VVLIYVLGLYTVRLPNQSITQFNSGSMAIQRNDRKAGRQNRQRHKYDKQADMKITSNITELQLMRCFTQLLQLLSRV